VESEDDFLVGRNVFIPDKENELPIKFKLSSDRFVRLEIFDVTGTKITNVTEGKFRSGWNTFQWNGLTEQGQKIGSGFYVLTIQSGEYTSWKKLMIVR
jgi:flagellar hook assembly protein FlgD